jgi:hypothetical protein
MSVMTSPGRHHGFRYHVTTDLRQNTAAVKHSEAQSNTVSSGKETAADGRPAAAEDSQQLMQNVCARKASRLHVPRHNRPEGAQQQSQTLKHSQQWSKTAADGSEQQGVEHMPTCVCPKWHQAFTSHVTTDLEERVSN